MSVRTGSARSEPKTWGSHSAAAHLIAYLDADDVWLPTKLDKQLALFRDRPEDRRRLLSRRC